ncbi:WD40-repeat-containing domain protein [Syncephalis plumigaleata]|nr:WD40-repeat-containing domain protein [Syncephalis plumigaleata]
MMPGPVPSTFQVSVATTQPVRKVRWLQSSHDYGQSTTYLLAGMHGNQQPNTIALYECNHNQKPVDNITSIQNDALDVQLKTTTTHTGEVMDIVCIDGSSFITASSKGMINTYSAVQNIDQSWELKSTSSITSSSAVCYTHLAVQPHVNGTPEVVTSSEDGRISLIQPESAQIQATSNAYCMPITGLTWLSSTQILASTCAGQLLIYDRNDLRKPVSVYSDRWDLRSRHLPASDYMQAHNAPVREIAFHPRYPDQLLSCSDGNASRMSY